ncbi:MAG: hypothetical protein KDC79_05880 [Cyclobacteriaceae bacterium]|nr:hypothetical protein [Cyclobacteriaceae bacterium]
MRNLLAVCLLIIGGILPTWGQSSYGGGDPSLEAKGFRNFLGNFSLHVSSGYGVTFYSHEINGPGILQVKDSTAFLFDNFYVISDTLDAGYSNWVNNAQAAPGIPVGDEDFLLGTDTLAVKYKATGGSIPISLAVSYTYDRYRFGVGFTYEQAFSTKYYPSILPGDLQPFKTNYATSSISRYYLYVGGEVFRSMRHTIAVDATLGTFKFGKKHYNPDQIKTKLFFNLGVSFERSLSEYFKVYVRPSAELKNYSLTVPGLDYKINHFMPAFYLNVGAILRMPDLHKCPISSCNTQRNHPHGDKLYRSRMHPFWKWQNPNYGQNYPQLVKYKGRNKKKLNPY